MPIVTVESNGAGIRCDVGRWPHSRGHQQRTDGEQLGDPDRGDGEHQPRRVPEAADERELDDRAEDDRAEQTDDEAEPHGQPQNTTRPTASDTGRNPRSAWAKLTIRFAR